MDMLITPPEKILNLAHKYVYLANQYPKKNLTDLNMLFQVPALDLNAALWLAEDLGLILIENKQVNVEMIPENWKFGNNAETLIDTLEMVIRRLNRNESDLEEEKLAIWCQGFPAHDYLVAINYLVNEGRVVSYQLRDLLDKKSVYTYYTLAGNEGNEWGKKQFKHPEKVAKVL